MAASAVVTDMVFVTWGVCDLAYLSTDKYAGEGASMLPIIFVVGTAPAVLLASIGFGRLAKRFWGRYKT